MMEKSTFQKIGKTETRMYGPTCILACGYASADQTGLLTLLKDNGFNDLPVLFASNSDLDTTLNEIMSADRQKDSDEPSDMNRAIIMSGFMENELHQLIQAYRGAQMPAQLWATLTPVSETWLLKDLLKELAAEAEAMRRQREKQ